MIKKNKNYMIDIKVLNDSGYNEAMLGISLNKKKNIDTAKKVSYNLYNKDFGHNKFLEHMYLWLLVKAPRYWWQEADTYRLSSKNSESTMHTILKRKLTFADFEPDGVSERKLKELNQYVKNKNFLILKKRLNESFLQQRMWVISYKTMRNIIIQRYNHRLPHWKDFCDKIVNNCKNPSYLNIKQ